MVTSENDESKAWYSVRCHCGVVKGKFKASKDHVVAWDCNCSDCRMRGINQIVILQDDFQLDMSESAFQEATIEYLWGTKTAKRRFCSTCGILPWYRPRSTPNDYGVTLNCVDWGENKPKVEIKKFDGQNYEKHISSYYKGEL